MPTQTRRKDSPLGVVHLLSSQLPLEHWLSSSQNSPPPFLSEHLPSLQRPPEHWSSESQLSPPAFFSDSAHLPAMHEPLLHCAFFRSRRPRLSWTSCSRGSPGGTRAPTS